MIGVTATKQARTALARMNGAFFHAVAAASLLEAGSDAVCHRISARKDVSPEVRGWLRGTWMPQKVARSAMLRDRIDALWPEFDWTDAWSAFEQEQRWRVRRDGGHTLSDELFTLSLAAAHSIFFYRALEQWSDDPGTREIAACALREELGHFDWLRQSYNACGCGVRRTFWEAAVGTRARQCRWRDDTVRMAFDAVAAGWAGRSMLAELCYDEFVSRLTSVICRTHEQGFMRRLLLKPWLSAPRAVTGRTGIRNVVEGRFALAA